MTNRSHFTAAATLLAIAFAIPNAYGQQIPVTFEANQGQVHSRVKFLSRGPGQTVFLTNDEIVLVARDLRDPLRLALLGANRRAAVVGVGELPGKTNYFIGNDPAKWRSGVSSYDRVRYRNIYPGIDLVYYGNPHQFEFDFVVSPGANPGRIRMRVDGAHRASIDANGDLVLTGKDGRELRLKHPQLYQEVGGERKAVDGAFVRKGREIRFRVGRYDRTRPLIIDPVLVYSSYLGGSAFDVSPAIAVDAAGNMYVTGNTVSADFPLSSGPINPAHLNGGVAFVAKINPNQAGAASRVYATYLGGDGFDSGMGIAVDAAGNVYIAGNTSSWNFPVTSGAFQSTLATSEDAFVAKLDSTGGTLLYATFFGGSSADYGLGLAVDPAGKAYVAGYTFSTDLPVSASAFQQQMTGYTNAFVAKFDPTQSGLASRVYATYLGGTVTDAANAIAADANGDAYVTGYVTSPDFPLMNPLQSTCPSCPLAGCAFTNSCSGYPEGFVTKINATGTALVYSTYLGGYYDDIAYGIAVSGDGSAYVSGYTTSHNLSSLPNFPVTASAFQSTGTAGSAYAFLTKINPGGTALAYSTLFGGSGWGTYGSSVAVDASGNAFMTGVTSSTNLPVTDDAFQLSHAGPLTLEDAFVAQFNPLLSGTASLIYSTYLGGSHRDNADGYFGKFGIAVDGSGNAYVSGNTNSTNFPITAGNAFQTAMGDPTSATPDAFVAKIAPGAAAVDLRVTAVANPQTLAVGDTVTYTITITNDGPDSSFSAGVMHWLSAGQTFAGVTGAACNPSPSAVSCTIGALAPGASTVITIHATADAAGSIDIQVAVTGMSPDPNAANNTAMASATVTGPPPPPSPAGAGTAVIDGTMTPGEWDSAGCTNFLVNLPGGGTSPATFCAMNDIANLYVSLKFDRSLIDEGNTFALEFDGDRDGVMEEGDDVFLLNPDFGFADGYRTSLPPCPAGAICGFLDTDAGGTSDGAGAFVHHGTFSVYELSHPLSSGDTHDFALCPGQKIGVNFFVRLINGPVFPSDFGDTYWPGPGQYSELTLSGECHSQAVVAGGVTTTDGEGDGATPDDVVETSVTSTAAGTVSISEAANNATAPAGYQFLGYAVHITAPPAPAGQYITIVFRVDASAIPAGTTLATINLTRNGVLLQPCAAQANPLPCFEGQFLSDGDVELTVYTAQASIWQVLVADDATAPSLSVTLSPDVLWPANHELVSVKATIAVADDADPAPAVTLVSIVSTEPGNGRGDGNTAEDIRGAALGTDDREFELRAERAGGGDGRIYTVTYRARDAAGNEATTSADVRVPLNKKRR